MGWKIVDSSPLLGLSVLLCPFVMVIPSHGKPPCCKWVFWPLFLITSSGVTASQLLGKAPEAAGWCSVHIMASVTNTSRITKGAFCFYQNESSPPSLQRLNLFNVWFVLNWRVKCPVWTMFMHLVYKQGCITSLETQGMGLLSCTNICNYVKWTSEDSVRESILHWHHSN